MLSCKDVSVLLSRACDTRLGWRERLAVRLHLLYCAGCNRLRRQLAFLQRAGQQLRTTAPGEARLPDAARKRIRERLRRPPA
jgi:Putative zinc-finger